MEYKEREYTDEDRTEDFNYFVNNHMILSSKYMNKYIIIRHKQIIAVYNDIGTAINITQLTYPAGTFSIYKCTGSEYDYNAYIL